MGAMVLLRHELPDGSAHLDWMLQRADEAAGLLTFRLSIPHLPIVSPEGGNGLRSIPAERLPDHRTMYLDYSGPVGGPSKGGAARGFVRRVHSGSCTILTETADLIEFEARFDGDEPGRWVAHPAPLKPGEHPPPNPLWHFSLATPA